MKRLRLSEIHRDINIPLVWRYESQVFNASPVELPSNSPVLVVSSTVTLTERSHVRVSLSGFISRVWGTAGHLLQFRANITHNDVLRQNARSVVYMGTSRDEATWYGTSISIDIVYENLPVGEHVFEAHGAEVHGFSSGQGQVDLFNMVIDVAKASN